ncbi:hypothetical protein acsn021_10880 [Anaerocolumna cellulosilytica]|uniref:Uncharacterized protein n=1 Tax=Anaerocolumna cellulosilytica TaxID=433286 RepID=A0A6S6QWT7_9FIRM|nr:hypothetical protein [Anaerocolumna cellulosilytica]MBB5194575.1 hypothetical protein [Anaerocolumna cellulosilytica]BCJ93519.1 hypothetical protein acsn021_10880 [Anaerocolumna cellulosilytica]
MIYTNIEIVPACTELEYQEYLEEDMNRYNKVCKKEKVLKGCNLASTLIIILILLVVYIKNTNEAAWLSIILIPLVAYFAFIRHDAISEYYKKLKQNKGKIVDGMVISHRLYDKEILCFLLDCFVLELEDKEHLVSAEQLDKKIYDVVNMSTLKDKVIINLKQNKIYIPYKR